MVIKGLLLSLVFLFSNAVLSNENIVAAPKRLETCVVCHGVEVKGNPSLLAPNLSVLSPWYVERQILNFQQDKRAALDGIDELGDEMQAMVEHYGREDLEAIKKYIREVPARLAPKTITGDSSSGKTLYQPCAACHGQRAEGNRALKAPRLAGQSDWYLVRQIENFKEGTRGSAKGDVLGESMRAAVASLKGKDEINDLVSYINILASQKEK